MHVRKGDQVVVIAGKEKGKRGRVLRLLTEKERVVIERINMVKRHTKPTQRNPRGGILEKEGSVTRGWLGVGIQELTPDLAKGMGLPVTEGAVASG